MATPSRHPLGSAHSFQPDLFQAPSSLLRWCSLFLLPAFLACSGTFAAEPTDPRLQELAERHVEAISTQAQQESVRNQPRPVGRAFDDDFPNAEPLLREEKADLEVLFVDQLEKLTEKIQGRKTGLDQKLKDLQGEWATVRADLYSKQIEISDTGTGTSFVGIIKVILESENRYFWLFSLIAMGILMVTHWHSRRHEYRRMMMGSRARSMHLARILPYLFLTFLGLFVVVFVFGNTIERLLGNISNPGATTFSTLEKEVDELETALDNRDGQALEGADGGYKGRRLKPAGTALKNQAVVEALIKVGVEYEDDIAELVVTNIKFEEEKEKIYTTRINRFYIRISFAGLLSLFVLGFSYMLFRNIKHYRNKIANTCPQCLEIGSFEPVESEHSNSNLDIVRCISEDKVYGGECGFELHGIHREKTKLSFPTLGVPQAGKTHWLCMLYRELIRGAFDDIVHFERVRGEGSDAMDILIEDILQDRLNPGATQPDALPKPVIFDFTDNDCWGKSNVLVNIFDYAGEITQSRPLDDPQRQRALDADGYLFFIDPTDGASAEEQAKALVDFQEDLRVINKISAGKSIRTPVAICVPKLDLMINQNYADPSGRGAVSRFHQELSALEQTDSSISLDIIKKRSELMMNFRETVWPGWRIERQINDLFGGRFCFFPLTPVGMTDLGKTDLRERTIEPFAILEPLMWLLHMNGFKVLS